MHAAFDASPQFDHDPLRTADEIQRCGRESLFWLQRLAESYNPPDPDIGLISAIHRRWFETSFPVDAGRTRTSLVANRKGTAGPWEGILSALDSACGNWKWRRENVAPQDDAELIEFFVAEANTLTVAVYDTHPFIDGNTRTTWHLRNYVLMLDGLRPLDELVDHEAHERAWWDAKPHDHETLDRAVLDELAAGDP